MSTNLSDEFLKLYELTQKEHAGRRLAKDIALVNANIHKLSDEDLVREVMRRMRNAID